MSDFLKPIFKSRLFYIGLLIMTVGFSTFYARCYCEPTIKLEHVQSVDTETMLGKFTGIINVTTDDGQNVTIDTHSHTFNASEFKDVDEVYIFRGKTNNAYSGSISESKIESDKNNDLSGWVGINVIFFIIFSFLAYVFNEMIPGKKTLFNKKRVSVII